MCPFRLNNCPPMVYQDNRQFSYRQQSEKMWLPPPGRRRSADHFWYRSESTGQPCWRGYWPSPATGSVDTLAHQWRSHTWRKEVENNISASLHHQVISAEIRENALKHQTVGIPKVKTTTTKVSATMCCRHKLHVLELHTVSEFKPSLDFKEFVPLSWSSVLVLGSKSAGSLTPLWSSEPAFDSHKCRWTDKKTHHAGNKMGFHSQLTGLSDNNNRLKSKENDLCAIAFFLSV